MSEEKRRLYRSLGFLSSVGISMVAATLLGLAIGYYLDQWLDTQPVFTLIMLLFGIAAGFRNVYVLTTWELRRQKNQDQADSDDD
ncbi:MAG: AtpZ/AtpI family protein [Pelovirga sp.]|jgi:ATP synthase protein I